MKHDIEAIVLYCSLEKRFIQRCVMNLLYAGVKVHVIYYDKLYGGEEDKMSNELLALYAAQSYRVRVTKLNWEPNRSALWLEAYARWFGTKVSTAAHLLYIDADEIVEPGPFRNWLDNQRYIGYKSMKLSQYLYSIQPTYRHPTRGYNTIIANGDYCRSLPFAEEARWNAYWNNKDKWSRRLAKLQLNKHFGYYLGKPFIHHYTNVRSVSDMVKKVTNWSHNKDRPNWRELAVNMFTSKTSKRISGGRYKIVENRFNIDTKGLYER